MKILLLALFLCAQIYRINACFEFGKQNINFWILQSMVDKKCATNGSDKQFSKSIENFGKCISHSVQNSTSQTHALESSQAFCSFLQESQFYMCLKNFTTDISPCLSENETYIQQLLIDAYDSAYEEICGNDGDSNFRYLYDKLGGPRLDCIGTSGILFVESGVCTGNLNIFKEFDKGVFNLNKHDVCRDFESFHNCSTEVLEGLCHEDNTRLTNLVLHPLLVGCSNLNVRK